MVSPEPQELPPGLLNVLRSLCGSDPVRPFAPSDGIHQSPGDGHLCRWTEIRLSAGVGTGISLFPDNPLEECGFDRPCMHSDRFEGRLLRMGRLEHGRVRGGHCGERIWFDPLHRKNLDRLCPQRGHPERSYRSAREGSFPPGDLTRGNTWREVRIVLGECDRVGFVSSLEMIEKVANGVRSQKAVTHRRAQV